MASIVAALSAALRTIFTFLHHAPHLVQTAGLAIDS